MRSEGERTGGGGEGRERSEREGREDGGGMGVRGREEGWRGVG